MSKSFPYYFKSLKHYNDFNHGNRPEFTIAAAILGLISHGLYTLSTIDKKTIEIKDKYQFTANGFTNFMIVDVNNNHYRVNNSFWYLKYDSIEDWCKMDKSNKIQVKFYGFRIPILGIFPNIIEVYSFQSNYQLKYQSLIDSNNQSFDTTVNYPKLLSH
jgi:hypothetical protein